MSRPEVEVYVVVKAEVSIHHIELTVYIGPNLNQIFMFFLHDVIFYADVS